MTITQRHRVVRCMNAFLCCALCWLVPGRAEAQAFPPDKLVVLTFDDSVKSHFTVVRPILLKYEFGATFFVTEGFDFRTNKTDYMTWEEIAQLHRDGFEIGNHTRDHLPIDDDTVSQLGEQLAGIDAQCERHGIPRPVSFAYPGNAITQKALPVLAEHGIRFARRGGRPEYPYEQGRGFAYEPGLDHHLLIPSAGDARPAWELADFMRAVQQARHGRIAVLQFHGVPDRAHPWVHTPRKQFEAYMHYLATHDYRVIALRDLERFVRRDAPPRNPEEVIQDRQRLLASGTVPDNTRPPVDDTERARWLRNMFVHHRFSIPEIQAATGMPADRISDALEQLALRRRKPRVPGPGEPLRVLPYPGGRHPRIGFRDGAIRPQRETKVSVFAPWSTDSYVVVDVPEAIWMETPEGRQLLYLAHTHVPTVWSRRGVELEALEWQQGPDGTLRFERTLPNQVRFGASVVPGTDGVRMELWLHNGTDQTLRGLRVQNCVMLGRADEFNPLSVANRRYETPYALCHDQTKRRWVITAWENCVRPWGNEYCPCLHSDPQFPDCPPGTTRRLRGWISFYEGDDVDAELARLDAIGWK